MGGRNEDRDSRVPRDSTTRRAPRLASDSGGGVGLQGSPRRQTILTGRKPISWKSDSMVAASETIKDSVREAKNHIMGKDEKAHANHILTF